MSVLEAAKMDCIVEPNENADVRLLYRCEKVQNINNLVAQQCLNDVCHTELSKISVGLRIGKS